MPAGRTGAALAAVLLVLLCGCAPGPRDAGGTVTAPATTDTFSVRVGDCLDKLPTDSADELSLLPCDQPHYWEAFATATLSGDDFPGNSAVRDQAEKACDAAFPGFVGVVASKSELDVTMLTPTKETWTQAADRAVVCLVGRPGGGVTGTLKGTAK